MTILPYNFNLQIFLWKDTLEIAIISGLSFTKIDLVQSLSHDSCIFFWLLYTLWNIALVDQVSLCNYIYLLIIYEKNVFWRIHFEQLILSQNLILLFHYEGSSQEEKVKKLENIWLSNPGFNELILSVLEKLKNNFLDSNNSTNFKHQ